ncbi:hypothetical protein HMPREF9012_1728 [Bacteroidetes bacterium oral taxon 272 str. F0290]|nr:hypothetical protein HMPREF9012_1728 [Bacteroidetes bacterium oral taxon 272 str. F0290]
METAVRQINREGKKPPSPPFFSCEKETSLLRRRNISLAKKEYLSCEEGTSRPKDEAIKKPRTIR